MSGRRYFQSLDGLRGLCSLMVLCDHWKELYPAAGTWIQQTGGEPVCLLFALSGFFMAYLYAGKRFNADAVATYLVHRLARIYPAYLVAVLLMAVLSYVPQVHIVGAIVGPVEITRHLLLAGNMGVFWSITPEIQFYLFFVLLWLFAAEPVKYQWLGIANLTFIAADVMLGLPGPGTMLPSKLPYFMLGVAAGYLYKRGFGARPGLISGMATVLLLGVYLFIHVLHPQGEVVWGVQSAVGAALLLFLAASDSPVATRVLGSLPFRTIGKVSFSLFLFHVPVFMLTHQALEGRVPFWLQTVLCWAAVFSVATLSFLYLETPSRKAITDRWHRRQDQARLPSTAPLQGGM
nr:acyltransferase [uncultured Gellertiella sp.]